MRRLMLLPLLLAACSDYEINKQGDPVEEPDDTEVLGEARLVVDPLFITFTTLAPGEEEVVLVTVSNEGDADLLLEELTLDADSVFSVGNLGSDVLEPGASTDFAVTYLPDEVGTFTGEVTVVSDVGEEVVTLDGDTLTPVLVVDPEEYDFGTVRVGESDALTITLYNEGFADLVIDSWSYSSSEASAMYLSDEGELYEGFALEPGGSTEVTVTYAPIDGDFVEGTLLVQTNDPDNPEGFASQEGLGEESQDYEVSIELTADDQWSGYLDGVEFTSSASSSVGWSSADTLTFTLSSGDHVFAVEANDTAAVVAGFLAAVSIDGTYEYLTGDGSWLVYPTTPSTGWEDVSYSSSAWSTASSCSASTTTSWSTSPSALRATGANWIWDSTNCRSLGDAWFRLEFTLP